MIYIFFLDFHVEPNDHFTNKVLAKPYKIKSDPHKAEIFVLGALKELTAMDVTLIVKKETYCS